jgi:hypothetical protein
MLPDRLQLMLEEMAALDNKFFTTKVAIFSENVSFL